MLRDPKKYFVWEVHFCQKKYIFDREISTNRAKSSFSDKIIYELPHFWPLIFVKIFTNFIVLLKSSISNNNAQKHLKYTAKIKIKDYINNFIKKNKISF